MTPDEARELQVITVRKRGKVSPYAHPDSYVADGSLLTICGVDWGVPPLYPSGSTSVVPTFGDTVTVDVHTDSEKVDSELVKLARQLQDAAPIEDGECCETCGQPMSATLEVDAEKHIKFLDTLFAYARRALDALYDLTNEQARALLRFDSHALPQWAAQALAHSLGQEG